MHTQASSTRIGLCVTSSNASALIRGTDLPNCSPGSGERDRGGVYFLNFPEILDLPTMSGERRNGFTGRLAMPTVVGVSEMLHIEEGGLLDYAKARL